jgi:AAA domain
MNRSDPETVVLQAWADGLRAEGHDSTVVLRELRKRNAEERSPRPDDVLRDIAGTSPDMSASPKLLSIAELFARPEETREWVVEGLAARAGTSLIVGKPKFGKSTLAQNLAVCVAQGTPFLDRSVMPGQAVYLALEEKEDEVKRHFAGIGARSGDALHVHLAAAPEDAMPWLREIVKTHEPVLIIIDPWQLFTRVRDVNDYAAVYNAMEPLMRLARESGAHLAFTHHGRKGGGSYGDGVLGSTALFGSVDTLIEMRRTEHHRTISTFQRYGVDMPESIVEMDPATFRISLGGTRQEADAHETGEEILQWLGDRTPVDEPTIRANVAGRTGVIVEALRQLVNSGRVQRAGDGKKGSPYLYSRSLVPTPAAERGNENTQPPVISLDRAANTRSELGLTEAACIDPEEEVF